ncbi:MAG TPA: NUDIX domain-containing protein [archaeon]|nr:NUDIX domain-containing protein [archaeon]
MNHPLEDKPNQTVVLVDSEGKPNGKISDRKTAHSTPGKKHLAIQVLVFNPQNELILHERPLQKVGGGVLDSPTTHVLAGETPEQAAFRCLRDEYGISTRLPITLLSGFSYEKDYGDGSCENEFCLAAFCTYSGTITPNPEQVSKIVKISAFTVAKELSSKPEKYPVWFHDTIKIVKNSKEGKMFF